MSLALLPIVVIERRAVTPTATATMATMTTETAILTATGRSVNQAARRAPLAGRVLELTGDRPGVKRIAAGTCVGQSVAIPVSFGAELDTSRRNCDVWDG